MDEDEVVIVVEFDYDDTEDGLFDLPVEDTHGTD